MAVKRQHREQDGEDLSLPLMNYSTTTTNFPLANHAKFNYATAPTPFDLLKT